MTRNCNTDPTWFHLAIRPFIREPRTFSVTNTWSGKRYTYTYWAKRPWYAALWTLIDAIKARLSKTIFS